MIASVKIMMNLEPPTIISTFDSNSNFQVKSQLIFAVKMSSSNETDRSCNDGNGGKGNSSSCLPNYFLRPACRGVCRGIRRIARWRFKALSWHVVEDAVRGYIGLKYAVIGLTAAIGTAARREVIAVAILAPAIAVALRQITTSAITLAVGSAAAQVTVASVALAVVVAAAQVTATRAALTVVGAGRDSATASTALTITFAGWHEAIATIASAVRCALRTTAKELAATAV